MLLVNLVNTRYTKDSPPQSRAYEELVEVVTRELDWPAEKEDIRSEKKGTNASCILVHNHLDISQFQRRMGGCVPF